MNYSYEADQIDRLGASDTYGIRIDNNGDEGSWGKTKRMVITADQLARIREILMEEEWC
ncbi:hypothetical protein [Rhodococcus qingshengii]|uniref:hypothetical protein n=1 Tax=Rhodococcus qingshengii TaxID=334542 RepID=UPI0035E04353